jgi:hypothetical protein
LYKHIPLPFSFLFVLSWRTTALNLRSSHTHGFPASEKTVTRPYHDHGASEAIDTFGCTAYCTTTTVLPNAKYKVPPAGAYVRALENQVEKGMDGLDEVFPT